MAMNNKDLNDLIKKLPAKDIPVVADFIKRLINNPLDAYIPFDDEPLSEDDLEAIKNAEQNFKNGNGIRLEDVEHELRNRD